MALKVELKPFERIIIGQSLITNSDTRTKLLIAGEAPILVVPSDEEPFEIVPPPLPRGHHEGCGDAMFGAIAAGWARRLDLRQALVLGAAAGSTNFLRRGLGTGRREVVEQLRRHVAVHPPAVPVG